MTSTFLESIHKTRNNSTAGLASYWSIALHDTGYRAFCWDPRPDAINALIRQRHITRKYNGITDNEIEIMNTEFQKLKPEMDRFVESWKQLTKFEPLTMVQDIALPHKYHLGFRVVDTISTASHTVSNYMATISTTKENNPEYYQKKGYYCGYVQFTFPEPVKFKYLQLALQHGTNESHEDVYVYQHDHLDTDMHIHAKRIGMTLAKILSTEVDVKVCLDSLLK